MKILTRPVYWHDDGSVLQLYRPPLVQLGCCSHRTKDHPKGGPHNRAVVQREVVAEVPLQVVPKSTMEHHLKENEHFLKYVCD